MCLERGDVGGVGSKRLEQVLLRLLKLDIHNTCKTHSDTHRHTHTQTHTDTDTDTDTDTHFVNLFDLSHLHFLRPGNT